MALGAVTLTTGRLAKAACRLTGYQIDGPFYPLALPPEQDADLTNVAGGSGRASGEIIEIIGQVQDGMCRPLPGCIIDVWQADAHGRYAHPLDEPRGRPLDVNFQGYARIATDKDGFYRFLTIKPGSYVAMGDWVRPPHIHIKVHAPFSPSLTTQMYFAGDPLNEKDLLQAALPAEQRARLQVAFDTKRADGVRVGTFNLVLAEGWAPPPELMQQLKSGG
ncbi:protocatechuate 3,4-dioxygenase [Rhodospirillaceae bacterium SYSU D60014]|uniref:dioxygenase family protein n=1 Tax=Virgifigura deserti TaxID=2268457 RepID=UPI0013C47C63